MEVEDTAFAALGTEAPSPVALIVDLDDRIVSATGAATELLGYRRLVGLPSRALTRDGQSLTLLARTHATADMTVELRRKDASGIHVPLTVAEMPRTGNDRLLYRFEIGAPLSELPACRAAPTSDFLQALFAQVPIPIHSIDGAGRLLDVSQRWLDLLGYRREEVIGHPSIEFLDAASAERARDEILPRFWREGRIDRERYVFLRRDGTPVTVEMSATLDMTATDLRTIAVLEDVTERERSINELESTNATLRDFAAVISHDLQAPLRQIAIYSEMIERDAEAGVTDGLVEPAAAIRNASNDLRRVVSSLRHMAETGGNTVDHRRADLGHTVKAACRALADQIVETGARISSGSLPMIACDPSLIQQVFQNLIANALKYGQPGVPPTVRIHAVRKGTRLRILVEDEGIGIPPEDAERVFEPMRRLDTSGTKTQGQGIGLALCRRIAEAHGGSVWLDTDYRRGARFVLALPLHISERELEQT